ncbi:MAG: enoyl-CoA hydratase/isomerase family protein [Deltaproteobacteria bacterium]|nr:enoyl-CoA hydratase/isomerase family protein [Deltaproteobacteria bacterium]MBI4373930.1 enoyl-CoA hydratase/isomerase family protein [Deltaproteobacteria bacterium]
MSFKDILYKTESGIATITLNRPEKLNAFRSQTIVELSAVLSRAIKDHKIGVIIISGGGGKAFCVGGDIQEMKDLDLRTGKAFARKLLHLGKIFLTSPKPIIAKVNGYCLGGGNEIQLFCDLTIASEKSIFGQTGPKVGSAPLWGGTQILPFLVGLKKAHEIIYLCRQYAAREAKEIGLINQVVPEISLDAVVERCCREILEKGPRSLTLARQALHEGLLPRLVKDLKKLEKIYGTPEVMEGMNAFLEKRHPSFKRG